MKRDLLQECNDLRIPEKEFRDLFCVRCKNPECVNAGFADSMWSARMLTQEDRLLINPKFADLEDPQFQHLRSLDFPDMLQQAMRLEISDRRKDWEVPDTDALSVFEPKQANTAFQATQDRGFEILDENGLPFKEDDASEDALDEAAPSAVPYQPSQYQPIETKSTLASPALVPAQPLHPPRPQPRSQLGGLMVDGSKAPPTPVSRASTPPVVHQSVDPWAAPPKVQVVPVGSKVKMGGETK